MLLILVKCAWSACGDVHYEERRWAMPKILLQVQALETFRRIHYKIIHRYMFVWERNYFFFQKEMTAFLMKHVWHVRKQQNLVIVKQRKSSIIVIFFIYDLCMWNKEGFSMQIT